jgi:ribonuclease BN (tRNA processing enzyme)
MEIRFLGTSGHGITLERNLVSVLIDQQILIDCGEGCTKTLYQQQIPLKNLKAVFISHMHSDHVIGLVSLLCQLSYYDHALPTLQIYMPVGMKSRFEAVLENLYYAYVPQIFKFTITELPLDCSTPLKLQFENNSYEISWIQSKHYPICYAFRFNNSVVLSGDGLPNSAMGNFAKNCALLIHEGTFPDGMSDAAHKVNHSTPSEIAEIAHANNVKRLIFYHVPDLHQKDEEFYLVQSRKIHPEVSVAHDLERIQI